MDQPSRRNVLRAAVVVAGSLALPAGLTAPAEALARPAPARLRRRVFRPYVGTSFLLVSGTTRCRAVLSRIADDPRRPGETRFALVFAMANGARPADGIYRVSHPRLKTFSLYVGAAGDARGGRYEAVVNS